MISMGILYVWKIANGLRVLNALKKLNTVYYVSRAGGTVHLNLTSNKQGRAMEEEEPKTILRKGITTLAILVSVTEEEQKPNCRREFDCW